MAINKDGPNYPIYRGSTGVTVLNSTSLNYQFPKWRILYTRIKQTNKHEQFHTTESRTEYM